MKKKRLLPLGILAVLVLAALIYTRPMTLQEIGKVDIAQCESVSGYHRRAPDSEFTSFELSAEDERCSQLIDLFAQQKFRRSLINLLSPDGGSTHQPKDGDFIWDLSFNFGPTDFPDGSTGKGNDQVRFELAITFGELVYDGQWFSPLRKALSAFVTSTQEHVTGKVRLELYKGNLINAGVWSPFSLYREDIATFAAGGDYKQSDATGFISIYGLPTKVQAIVSSEKEGE